MFGRVTRVSLSFVQLSKEQLLPALEVPVLFMIATWEIGLQYHKRNVYGKDFSVQLSRLVLKAGGKEYFELGNHLRREHPHCFFRIEHLIESAHSGLNLKHSRWLWHFWSLCEVAVGIWS